MTETTVVESRSKSIGELLVFWVPRIAVALLFLFIGSGKFQDRGVWVRIFDNIGVGQWFRYLTGALQMGGALLVLVPRTFLIGIGLLACTMLGACLAWMTVLNAPFNMVIPGTLLLVLLAVGAFEWFFA